MIRAPAFVIFAFFGRARNCIAFIVTHTIHPAADRAYVRVRFDDRLRRYCGRRCIRASLTNSFAKRLFLYCSNPCAKWREHVSQKIPRNLSLRAKQQRGMSRYFFFLCVREVLPRSFCARGFAAAPLSGAAWRPLLGICPRPSRRVCLPPRGGLLPLCVSRCGAVRRGRTRQFGPLPIRSVRPHFCNASTTSS